MSMMCFGAVACYAIFLIAKEITTTVDEWLQGALSLIVCGISLWGIFMFLAAAVRQ